MSPAVAVVDAKYGRDRDTTLSRKHTSTRKGSTFLCLSLYPNVEKSIISCRLSLHMFMTENFLLHIEVTKVIASIKVTSKELLLVCGAGRLEGCRIEYP